MSESSSHILLKEDAKKKLLERGMTRIYEEYRIKIDEEKRTKIGNRQWELGHSMIVDVVGFNDEKSIAIECGECSIIKIRYLEQIFTEVIQLPHIKTYGGKIRKKLWCRVDLKELEKIDKLVKKQKYEDRAQLIRRALIEFLERQEQIVKA